MAVLAAELAGRMELDQAAHHRRPKTFTVHFRSRAQVRPPGALPRPGEPSSAAASEPLEEREVVVFCPGAKAVHRGNRFQVPLLDRISNHSGNDASSYPR